MRPLRLATFNVWGLPSPASRHPAERLAAIGARLPELELDVLGCQEVWTGSARHALLEAGRRSGLVHSWHRERAFGGSGLLILSRWPLRETQFRPFRLGGLPQRIQHLDYYGGKGVVRAVVETPAGELEFANTHLHAAYGWRGFEDEYLGHRVAQMIELADELGPRSRPLVLSGDLNCVADGDEFAVLRGLSGLHDTAAELGAEAATVVPGSAYHPEDETTAERIDYLLFRAGVDHGLRPLQVRRAFDEEVEIAGQAGAYSDHAAVVAEIELGGPGAPLPSPRPEAIALARELLAHGREVARARRSGQRRKAGATGAVALAAGAASTRRPRRDWLWMLLVATSAALAAPALAFGALAEGFTPGELRGYDEAEAVLDALAARALGP